MKTEELFPADFISRLENLAFVAKKIRRGRFRGEHPTYRRGSSLEFYDYRAYRAGDDLRYIDWNIYERLGKLVTKVFSAEEDLAIHFFLDASASMAAGRPAKIVYGSRVCAALAYIGISNLDRVGITWFSDAPMGTLPPVRRRDMFPVLSFLSGIRCGGRTGFNPSLARVARTTRVPGLAVVISDLLIPDGFREGLLSLLYRHWEVVVIHLIAREDYEPEEGGELRLVDAESNRRLDLVVDRKVRAKYTERISDYRREIEGFCLDKRIEYVPVKTTVPVEQVVLRYLRKGAHLH